MKLGLHYEMSRPELNDHLLIQETMEQIVLADEVGFDYVWLVEHHFLTGFSGSSCPEVMAAALSQCTKQIRLGMGVIVLPYHHPCRVAERVATLDHLSMGRVDFGTGRSAPYELLGMGINPEHSRDMWNESLSMIPKIWESDWFEWEGKYWSVPARQGLPKPYQKPHPPIWVAALQPATYQIAAQKGLGVLAMGAADPHVLEPHIQKYHENVSKANPVGSFSNEQWCTQTFAICMENDRKARELVTRSIREFYGPDRPYTRGQKDVYRKLLNQWGGVPKHLERDFLRNIGDEADEKVNGRDSDSIPDFIAEQAWMEMDADTLCDRAVIIGGNPDSCIKALKMHQAVGVDQVDMVMQCETVTHATVMESIEMFGKYVIPEFKGS